MKLVEPNAAFEATYHDYVTELTNVPARIPFVLTYPAHPFSDLVQNLLNQSRGIGVRQGFVPNSTFWLIDDDEVLVGVSSLRHSLTESLLHRGGHIGFGVRPSWFRQGIGTQLLALTLRRAADVGLKRVLLTCDKDNVASAAVITAHQGQLDNEVVDTDNGNTVQRYCIDVP
jgi:predicted acetyltransferase